MTKKRRKLPVCSLEKFVVESFPPFSLDWMKGNATGEYAKFEPSRLKKLSVV
jgi:hypothetical protein